jgi:branched-chain amino acid transport system ATP-binding protein
LLQVNNINVFYNQLQALWDVSIEVKQGEFLTVLGSNGAGKSTLLKAISGINIPAAGSITFKGAKINGLYPYKICEMGMVQIPQGRQIFPDMKISENLEMGAYIKRARKNIKKNLEKIYSIYPILEERSEQMAGTLSGGEQQMLAIGRGLMSEPELLMLDEPTLGLSPKLAIEMLSSLTQMHDQGITLLLVSQETLQCLKIAERAYVMENGRISVQGPSHELLNSEAIRKAYLGI